MALVLDKSMFAIFIAAILVGCSQPVTYEEADTLFSERRSAFELINRKIIDCGARAFDVGDGQSPGEDCVTGQGQAQAIEKELERLGIEYVNVDWRNFDGFNRAFGVTYILSRDHFGGGGDAQSIVWLANPQPVSNPDYRGARHRPLSAGVKGWYFEEVGPETNRSPREGAGPI